MIVGATVSPFLVGVAVTVGLGAGVETVGEFVALVGATVSPLFVGATVAVALGADVVGATVKSATKPTLGEFELEGAADVEGDAVVGSGVLTVGRMVSPCLDGAIVGVTLVLGAFDVEGNELGRMLTDGN